MNEIIPVVIVLVAGMIILIVRLFTLRMREAEINYFVDLVSEIADQMERGYSITETVSGIIKNNEGHKCTKILQRIMDAYNNGEDISAVKEEINKKHPEMRLICSAIISAFSSEADGAGILKDAGRDLREVMFLRFERIKKTSGTAMMILFTSVIAIPFTVAMAGNSFDVPQNMFISMIVMVQGLIAAIFYGIVKEDLIISASMMGVACSIILIIFSLMGV
ncbi:MAG: type II secretion system F family protein [Candidatus Aenigmarchaeota archaeon]|nr:type II secretion system F family protein [Candidatus Aenigmarchaeota archaeon]